MINYNVELNENRQNINIKACILSDEKMREIGFSDHCVDRWYFNRIVSDKYNITFNVTINKKSNKIDIRILFDDWCQPCNYQKVLHETPNFPTALSIHKEVQKVMKYLMNEGVITGYTMGDYI